MVIFAYDDWAGGVLPEVQVLSHMLSYFGPLPPRLVKRSKSASVIKSLYRLIGVLTKILLGINFLHGETSKD